MRNKTLGKNFFRAAVVFLSAAMLFMAWLTLHDMQKSEGIGLYYSTVIGTGGASGMGMAVEALGMLVLFALVLLPCVLFRRFRPECFLRLLTAYLAFMPTISLAYLVHLLNGTEEIKCSEALLAGDLWQALWEAVTGIVPMLAAGIPLMILVKLAAEGEHTVHQLRARNRRGVLGLACGFGILLVLAVVFPALKEVSTFWIRYLLLLYGFCLWERLYEVRPQYQNWGWLIFGIFGLRGIYTMAEVMSVYHL